MRISDYFAPASWRDATAPDPVTHEIGVRFSTNLGVVSLKLTKASALRLAATIAKAFERLMP